jgi:formylglycine-generating enzyme required for sulfatase activity
MAANVSSFTCLAISVLLLGAPVAGAQAPATQATVQKLPGTLVEFTMVRIKTPGETLWISSTEVTWDLYDVFAYSLDLTEKQRTEGVEAESRPSKPYGAPDRGFGHQGYPAIGIASHAAEEFCRWLSVKTGHKYRLPTEGEWERAMGATLERTRHDEAWFASNSMGKTHPVAKKKANQFGLYDMLGNAAEWCQTAEGGYVVRGGSYLDESVGSGSRQGYQEYWQESDPQDPKSRWWLSDGPEVGFRVVRED